MSLRPSLNALTTAMDPYPTGWYPDPSETIMAGWQRENDFDARRQQEQADEDERALLTGAHPNVFNRIQQAAATGPAGYNRSWVPFFEALRGKKVNTRSLDLPLSVTSVSADPWSLG